MIGPSRDALTEWAVELTTTGQELSVVGGVALVVWGAARPAPGAASARWLRGLVGLLVLQAAIIAIAIPEGAWHANGHDLSRWGATRWPLWFPTGLRLSAHGQTTFTLPWLLARALPWTASLWFTAVLTTLGTAAFAEGTRRLTGSGSAALGATALLGLHPFILRLAPTGAYGPAMFALFAMTLCFAERWRASGERAHLAATIGAMTLLAQAHAECLGLAPAALAVWWVARGPARAGPALLVLAASVALLLPRGLSILLVSSTQSLGRSMYRDLTPFLSWVPALYLFSAAVARASLPPTTRIPRAVATSGCLLAGAVWLAWPSPGPSPWSHAVERRSLDVPADWLNHHLAPGSIVAAAAAGALLLLVRGGRTIAWLALPVILALPYAPVRENLANRVEWAVPSLYAVGVVAAFGVVLLPRGRAVIALLCALAALPAHREWLTLRLPDQSWAKLVRAVSTEIARPDRRVAIELAFTPEGPGPGLQYSHVLGGVAALPLHELLESAEPPHEVLYLRSPNCYMLPGQALDPTSTPGYTARVRMGKKVVRDRRTTRHGMLYDGPPQPFHELHPCHHRPDLWRCVATEDDGDCNLYEMEDLPECHPAPPFERTACADVRSRCELEPLVELTITTVNPHGEHFEIVHPEPMIGAYLARCRPAETLDLP